MGGCGSSGPDDAATVMPKNAFMCCMLHNRLTGSQEDKFLNQQGSQEDRMIYAVRVGERWPGEK